MANDVSAPGVGFEHDTNAVVILGADGAAAGDPPHRQAGRGPRHPRRSLDHKEQPVTRQWTFTSESVTEGHPDKMADQISDSILDAILTEDPMARVACETMVTTGLAIVAGEITTERLRRDPADRPQHDHRHRLRPRVRRLRRQHLRRDHLDRPAVARHRPGRRHRARDPHRRVRRGPAQQPGRRRPGDDVRLRRSTRPPTSCRCRSGWPTGWPSGWPRSASPACCRTSGPTARPRSPSTTRATRPSASPPCSSPRSTSPASTPRRSSSPTSSST